MHVKTPKLGIFKNPKKLTNKNCPEFRSAQPRNATPLASRVANPNFNLPNPPATSPRHLIPRIHNFHHPFHLLLLSHFLLPLIPISFPSIQTNTPMDSDDLKRVFQMFDRNGDGSITKKELSDSLRNLGIHIPDAELQSMIDKIDANGDGCIDIDEFGALYQSIMDERGGDEDEEDDMREAFNVFDQNGDGFITVEELRSVLSSLGLKQGRTVDDCRRMIRKVDVDGDGMVNFKEFKQMMRGGGFAALT